MALSAETMDWLNKNVLIGFTQKRGTAWHYRKSDQGEFSNHYEGPIPIRDVQRRLFSWEPLEADVYAASPHGSVRAEANKAIVRSDTGAVLGIVSRAYSIHRYDTWLLQNVGSLLGQSAGIGSAGLLKGGALAWVQVEVPDTVTFKGVNFRPFLTATTSLDGSASTTYLTGAQVVVCDNTLSAALRDKDAAKLRIRHTKFSELRIDDAAQALDLLHVTKGASEEQVREQVDMKVSDDVWKRFLRAHFPLKNEHRYAHHKQFEKRRRVHELWTEDERVAPWNGTAYGVVAAINTYEHHFAEGQAKSQRSRAERNAIRAMTGGFDDIDAKTMTLLRSVM